MSELKFSQFKIKIVDHHIDDMNEFVCFDLTLNPNDVSDIFKFVETYGKEHKIIEYYIDNNRYNGNFGNLIHDSKGNARLWMTTKPTNKPATDTLTSMVVTKKSVPYYNLLHAFVDLEKRFNMLTDLLKEKDVITQEEVKNIGYYLTPKHDGVEIKNEVKDLKEYLEDTENTLKSIRLKS